MPFFGLFFRVLIVHTTLYQNIFLSILIIHSCIIFFWRIENVREMKSNCLQSSLLFTWILVYLMHRYIYRRPTRIHLDLNNSNLVFVLKQVQFQNHNRHYKDVETDYQNVA